MFVAILEPRSSKSRVGRNGISEERILLSSLSLSLSLSMGGVRKVWWVNVQMMLDVWSLSITRTMHHFGVVERIMRGISS